MPAHRAATLRVELNVRTAVLVVGTMAAVWRFVKLVPVVLVVIVAMMIVRTLNPLVERLEHRGMRRRYAILTVFSGLFLAVAAFAALTIPRLVVEASMIGGRLPQMQAPPRRPARGIGLGRAAGRVAPQDAFDRMDLDPREARPRVFVPDRRNRRLHRDVALPRALPDDRSRPDARRRVFHHPARAPRSGLAGSPQPRGDRRRVHARASDHVRADGRVHVHRLGHRARPERPRARDARRRRRRVALRRVRSSRADRRSSRACRAGRWSQSRSSARSWPTRSSRADSSFRGSTAKSCACPQRRS